MAATGSRLSNLPDDVLRCILYFSPGYSWLFSPMPMGARDPAQFSPTQHDPGPIIIGLRAARARYSGRAWASLPARGRVQAQPKNGRLDRLDG